MVDSILVEEKQKKEMPAVVPLIFIKLLLNIRKKWLYMGVSPLHALVLINFFKEKYLKKENL